MSIINTGDISTPNQDDLLLIADVQAYELKSSSAFNRKMRGIISEGVYSGFLVSPSTGLNIAVSSAGESAAAINVGEKYLITVKQQHDITLNLPAGVRSYICLKAFYEQDVITDQVDANSSVKAAHLVACLAPDTHDDTVVLAAVDVPSQATEITADMIDLSVRQGVSLEGFWSKLSAEVQLSKVKWVRAFSAGGFLPSVDAVRSAAKEYLGTSAAWFKETWSNVYRGGSIDVEGSIKSGGTPVMLLGDHGLGANSNLLPNGSDLHAIELPTGFYRGEDLVNAPNTNGGWTYIAVQSHSPTYKVMFATPFGEDGVEYVSIMRAGAWSAWNRNYSPLHKPSKADVGLNNLDNVRQFSHINNNIGNGSVNYAAGNHKHPATDLPTASTTAYGATKLSSATNSVSEALAATPKAVKAAYDKASHSHPYAATSHSHGAADLPSASTAAKGVVQLTSSVSSTSELLAASAKAVKAAYDKANHSHPYAASSHSHGVADLPTATTTAKGVVQLSTSISSTSTALAATASAVKAAYDKASHAHPYLPTAGGVLHGDLSLATNAELILEGGHHRFTHNDGAGNFNFRLGNKFDAPSGDTVTTVANGTAFHQVWSNDDNGTGTHEFRVSSGSDYAEGDVPVFVGQIRYDRNVVSLRYRGAERIATTEHGVTVFGSVTADSFKGNADSATKLRTARKINGVSFDGSQDVTTPHWGASRVLTIGNAAKNVNGAGAISWTLSEIGAAAKVHSHAITDVTGLQLALERASGLNVGGSNLDPDTTASHVMLTNHVNSPDSSKYWHVTTTFYSSISNAANRGQIAVEYNPSGAARMYFRSCYSGVWSDWTRAFSTSHKPTWNDVTGKPATITPSAHSHGAGDLPTATTSAKGVVQLSSSVSSTSTTLAATASAVKAAYDKGNHSHPYAATSHTHSYDNYNGWDLMVNGGTANRVTTGENVDFKAGTNVTLSVTGTAITINSSYVNTWRTISDSVSSTSTGVSASSKAVKTAYDKANHSHPYAASSHSHGAGDLPSATTSAKGVVQLSSSVSSTSTTLAATASAVRTAYNKANHSHPYAASSHSHTPSQVGLSKVPNTTHTTAATANTVAVRDNSGDISVRLCRSNYANESAMSGALAFRKSTTDNYIRFCSSTSAIRSWLGVAAASHSHSYLPLSGGTISNSLHVTNDLSVGGAISTDDVFNGNLSGNATTCTTAAYVTCRSSGSGTYYDMLWRSGNGIYYSSSTKIQCQASTGNIRTKGHVTFGYTSDIRIKRNLAEFDNPLEKVLGLRTGYYEKLVDVEVEEGEKPRQDYVEESGFIAQDLEKAVDGLIYENEDGVKTIKGGGFEIDALLAGAIKQLKREHQAEIDDLKRQMSELVGAVKGAN